MEFDLLITGGTIVDGTGNPGFKGDIGLSGGMILSVINHTDTRTDTGTPYTGFTPINDTSIPGTDSITAAVKNNVSAPARIIDASTRFTDTACHGTGPIIIDATGLVVAPGFVDPHSHFDHRLLVYHEMASTLLQGVTTIVTGQCGYSAAPVNPDECARVEELLNKSMPPGVDYRLTWTTFSEYLERVETLNLGANIAFMVGHGTIREAVVGEDDRPPTEGELDEMKRCVEEAMRSGVCGLSSGLIYPPGIYAATGEIVALAEVAARLGGIYSSHIRGEGNTLLEAVAEAIEIGERAGLPVQISHLKASGKPNWGKTAEALRMMEEAQARGVDVACDQYPYLAGCTGLSVLLPPWVHDGGNNALLERLKDHACRCRIRRDMESGLPGWENFAGILGWENIMVTHVRLDRNKPCEGRTMAEITRMRGAPDEYTALFDLLLEEEVSPQMVGFSMREEDMRQVMAHPLQMVGSDSASHSFSGPFAEGKPHPRSFGTYPRILGRYVREHGVLGLEEAVRKMTSLPAVRHGFSDRGFIRPGMAADLTVFDPTTVIDHATYQEPHQKPDGIRYVIVNGEVAAEAGELTGRRAGQVLRKQSNRRR